MNIFPSSGQLTIDYITYTPNTDTPLSGVHLILDDNDPILEYSTGQQQWNHTTGDFQAGRPYNGTMTGASVINSTMQLTFEGECALVMRWSTVF